MDESLVRQYPELERDHFWWRLRRRVVKEIIRNGPVAGRPKVLDIGCGSGYLLAELSDECDVIGIEPDGALAAAGPAVDRILVGTVQDVVLQPCSFDYALMLDVLEHIDTPVKALKRVRDALTPSGTLVVTVPAYRWLWTSHDDLNNHVDRFTPGRLRALLVESGFEVLRSEALFAALVLPKAVMAVVEHLRTRSPRPPAELPRWLNESAFAWFRLERAVTRRLPQRLAFGTSLLAIARRGR